MNNKTLHPAFRVLGSALLCGLIGSAALAQAPAPATPSPAPAAPAETAVPADKVVLKVGGRQFTKAELDLLISTLTPQIQNALATRGRKDFGDQYALLVALSEQAQAQRLDQSAEFAQRLAFQKDQLEAQQAYEVLNTQTKVTPDEIQQYYTAHADDYDEITVRQIIVRKKADQPAGAPAHPEASPSPGLTPAEAQSRAEAIRKELLAGTDIKKVLDDFKAPGDVLIDAEPRSVRHGGMRPDMEKVAFALKDGEISTPLDVQQAVVMFQVIKHTRSDLKEVSPEIERKLRQEKVQATLDGVKKSANIWMDETYFGASTKPTLGPKLEQVPGTPQGKQ